MYAHGMCELPKFKPLNNQTEKILNNDSVRMQLKPSWKATQKEKCFLVA